MMIIATTATKSLSLIPKLVSLTPVDAFFLRGGAAVSSKAVDLTRMGFRLDGLASYAVVSALLMSASLGLYSSTSKNLEYGPDQKQLNIIKVAFAVLAIVSIVGGSYTTVVFSLLGMYAKTALGLGKDEPFLTFMDNTANIRKFAFDSFLLSLVAFQCSFVSSVFITYKGRPKPWLACLAALGAVISFWHWGLIMVEATKLVFS